MSDVTTRPNRIPWPPMLFVVAALAAALAEAVVPTTGILPPAVGWTMVAAGLGLDVSAVATMMRARTNVLPHRAADQLVTHGPFRLTRNPIYLGNTLVLAGAGPVADTTWAPVAALAMAVAVHNLAVLREERHLAARFGVEWERYARATPRWAGLPGRSGAPG